MDTGEIPTNEHALTPTKVAAAHSNPRKTESATDNGATRRPSAGAGAEPDITTRIFTFLSTATPGTLGGIAVGMAAGTYLVLGQVGLVLIGAFAGVVGFIHWEAANPEVSRAVKGEKGVDLLARLLGDIGAQAHKTQPKAGVEDEETFDATSFADFQPETRAALTGFVDAVIRDYVNWWYSPILPTDRSFAFSCRKALTAFLLSMSNHLGRKRPADAFLDFLTNSSSIVIVFFSELSTAFAELPPDSKMTAADTIYNYLASNPHSSLSTLLSQTQQAAKFKVVADDLLVFLDRPMHECDSVKVFLREIIAGVILETTLQTCSKPEWINGWIVYLLEAGEPNFSQAIDSGIQNAPDHAIFADLDGNVGNIGLTKGNHNSFDTEKSRRKEATVQQDKQLARANEADENAMEEMKRMNEMLTNEAANGSKPDQASRGLPNSGASERLADALQRNADDLDLATMVSTEALAMIPESSSPEHPPALPPRRSDTVSSSSTSQSAQTQLRPTTAAPIAPKSAIIPSQDVPATSFDQILPSAKIVSGEDCLPRAMPALMLHNAVITIYDDDTVDKAKMRTRPTWDYTVQVEPASSQHPGWMIARQYNDFEILHEVLRRIANVSGAKAFTEQHSALPAWKMHTRASLRGELERYIRDACWYQPLAECEGMKRFLDKDQATGRQEAKTGLQAFENMGKNMLGVLASAPKGVAEGGKVLAGGVTGVFGTIGLGPRKNTSMSIPEPSTTPLKRVSMPMPMPSPQRTESALSLGSGLNGRDSIDSQRSSVVSVQPGMMPPMDRRPSYQSQGDVDLDSRRPSRSDRWERPLSAMSSRASSMAALRSPGRSPSMLSLDVMKLPPPPDAIPDDYSSPLSPAAQMRQDPILRGKINTIPIPASSPVPNSSTKKRSETIRQPRHWSKLSEQETQVAVELVFAIITELYTLSSAWNIRRTLLAAAKSFLLRPGNPSLVSIQTMLQTSVIEANTSDAGIAAQLEKLRANTMPTDEERAAWPAEMTAEEKERLRVRARQLLLQGGVPAALTGVMGQNATSDALGKIFDCLQIVEVARGLIFGIMLQAVRIVTH